MSGEHVGGPQYHEKQRLQFCAVHSINNLFQDGSTCSKEKLDDICLNLDPSRWNNQHRSRFGLGNYDINVIMSFLQLLNYDVLWFDKRKCVSSIQDDHVFGYLLNTSSPPFGLSSDPLGMFKHWYAVRKFTNHTYYNLDSKLANPKKLGSRNSLIQHLKEKLHDGRTELLLVVVAGTTKEQVIKEEVFETTD